MKKYKRFRIGTIFASQNGDFDIQQKHVNGNGILVVSSGETNMGIIGKTDVKARIFFAGTITVDMFGNANYRGYDYKMVTHARVFSLSLVNGEKLSREIGLYFAAQFGFFKKMFSYNDMASWFKIKNLEISLPITASGNIDFRFMENYIRELELARIRELELARIRELEAYLKVTGLTDYKLTAEEEKVLVNYHKSRNQGTKRYKPFRLGELFEISTPNRKFNANSISFGGEYRYVARGESNNGIRGYITEAEQYLNPAKTISFGQDTATMFYQDAPYFTGDKIKIFTLKNKGLTRERAVYLIAAMKKAFVTFAWGRSSFNVSALEAVAVHLPVDNNGTPDYDYMTMFIRIQQKLAIKNVVDWKDRELETYRIVTAK